MECVSVVRLRMRSQSQRRVWRGVKEDGKRELVRARVFHVTDDHLAQLVAYLTGRVAVSASAAEVVELPIGADKPRGGVA